MSQAVDRAPAIIWNHGSEPDPDRAPLLARFYVSRGFTLFLPHRRGHGLSTGEYPLARLKRKLGRGDLVADLVALQQRYLLDTRSAFEWLAAQPFVDRDRVAMSGVSHGGIQTLLAAGADVGAKAYVAFAPAAMAWDTVPALRELLADATRRSRAPIFLLQAENDYSLGPSEILGAELRNKGEPNRARIYPSYGDTRACGHGAFACAGTDVWGQDVFAFLQEVLPNAASYP